MSKCFDKHKTRSLWVLDVCIWLEHDQGGSCGSGLAPRNYPLFLLWDLRNAQNCWGCLIHFSSHYDWCHFMGLHRSQKWVISSAGSFPLLNNGALILGFPGLSSVDFGRQGDCVCKLSAGASLTSVSLCLPSSHALCARPRVPARILIPVALSTDTLSLARCRKSPFP